MANLVVAVSDCIYHTLDPAKQVLSEIGAELRLADGPTPAAILEAARSADGLLVTLANITADIIDQLENCRVIGRFGVGTDNIDIGAATRNGIVVTYAPVYCLDEVSDHVMALLLALARKIAYANHLVHAGRWETQAVVPIHRLRGRTIGLVGLGNIPRRLAPKAQAFGLRVIAFDPYVCVEVASALNVELVTFEALLERSDYVSVHAPLTAKTRNLFGRDAFRRMKPGALLINTARGPLVDVEALAWALDAGEIAGAAMDVMPSEPPASDCPVLGRDNVIITPHTAFYSEDALLDLQTTVARDVRAVLRGETPAFPINAKELGVGLTRPASTGRR